ncbi:nitroreductase family protein [Ligilactobacillus acidipiscis]|uniref:nitroreductase family protein n=1 Tax=Ligilactobacillus acidipiscis TaxID=89059 RepID=UPI0022DF18B3|nr:nitroreductase family protein [Ligilactobacillus acidipiscis]
MDIMQTIYQRQAVRDFSDKQVPTKDLQDIMDAGQAGPVGMGEYEKFHFTLLTNSGAIKQVEADSVSNPYYGAPAVIIISAQKQDSSVGSMECVSAGAMVENMALAATGKNLASCVIMGALIPLSKDDDLLSKLQIPAGFAPVISLAVGYPAESISKPTKGRHEVTQTII